MSEIEILTHKDAISVIKSDKTAVDYYIFREFEIHECITPAHTKQVWHKHEKIEEVFIMKKGELQIHWIEDKIIRSAAIKKGNILRVKNSIHTIENAGDIDAIYTVLRFVPTGEDKRETIKNDKVIYKEENLLK